MENWIIYGNLQEKNQQQFSKKLKIFLKNKNIYFKI